ncbi:hypothetical protein [uncultured Alsobacter sp.]|uniref:hypothetical protein n=1 Tax=uncultured Alsobacter sp. TaxID=1748258 RepID=UPI0025F6270A|nr:hypothetical protein [uncultured Alsobacter sp.]
MAQIQSGDSSALLSIHPTAKAARGLLYGPDGSLITRQRGEAGGLSDYGLAIMGMNDDNYRMQRMDRTGGAAVSLNNVLFSEPFEGATISVPNRLTSAATTFTVAQSASLGLNFNSTAITTSTSAALVTTNRRFMRLQRAPLHLRARARFGHVANTLIEIGFGAPANQISSPTVGAYFQCTAAGVVHGVWSFNGVDTTTTPFSMPSGWQSNFYVFDVILDDDDILFMIQDTTTGLIVGERRIQLPSTGVRMWDATRLPAFGRLYYPAAPATPGTLILSALDVVLLDAFMNKPWAHTSAHMGLGGEVLPTTFAQAAQWANSAAPSSAALSNTTPGYTTLGGLWQFAAVAGAATDYILFGFTVPSPYSFVCTGVTIDAYNTGAAVATTPSLLAWAVSPDQTAASLATANNRRVPLGAQSFAVGAAIGARADRVISEDFSNSPLVTNPGRILGLILRMPIGTATASQVIAGTALFKGYFE